MTRENATLADFKSGRFGACKIAVLVPCYNEEKSVGKVVDDFRTALPAAAILVYDNNSTDNTARVARAAGAEVFHEARQGKGFVVRRMFADVDADIYVLVDGDATYDAPSVRRMIGQSAREAARHGRGCACGPRRGRPIAPDTAPATGC